MEGRPYVLLSCAMSLDGHLDDATGERLLLSNDADFDRVDEVRAGCDAILVGATTIRRDDPRLAVRSPARRAARVAAGKPATPLRATLTRTGDLDPAARFFTGEGATVVYGPAAHLPGDAVPVSDPAEILADLAGRGVERLLVEGGSTVLTLFLTAGLADELHLVVAPFFVGDPAAPRFVGGGAFPWHRGHRARLAGLERIGDLALLRYALSERANERR